MTAEEIARLEKAINQLRDERARDWRDFRDNEFLPMCKRNDDDHQSIMLKQDATNSNVSELKLWRARIEGALFTGKLLWAGVGVGMTILGVLLEQRLGG